MKNVSIALLALAILILSGCGKNDIDTPIHALLITGGCCHDYDFQKQTLTTALSQRAPIEWTIVHEGGDSRDFQSKLFNDPNWSADYDVVVHNECYANTAEPAYISKVVSAHKAGTPAIVIHCAMHTYRAAEVDDWREFLGVTTRRHDHLSHYPTTIVDADHPIIADFPTNWVSPMDELYIIEKLWPNAKALVTGKSEKSGESHPVFWTNQYGNARVFGTTFGHTNETIANPDFQDIVARGILWVTGRLN
jgi:type 1 glutamine amidotransferase